MIMEREKGQLCELESLSQPCSKVTEPTTLVGFRTSTVGHLFPVGLSFQPWLEQEEKHTEPKTTLFCTLGCYENS